MTYAEAMRRTDPTSPTCGSAWRSVDLGSRSPVRILECSRTVDGGGEVAASRAGPASSSRSQIDELDRDGEELGAAGLVWARLAEGARAELGAEGAGEAGVRAMLDARRRRCGRSAAAGRRRAGAISLLLGRCGCKLAQRREPAGSKRYNFLWVTDFPLFEWDDDEQRWESMHHPFTSPLERTSSGSSSDPGSVRAKAYDLVLNGSEIGGGTIRIHDATAAPGLQAARHRDEEARRRFGFFLDALEYGTPPHGGIALGPR